MLNTTASLMNLVVLPLMVFAIMVPVQLVKPRHRYLVAIVVTLIIGAYAVTLHSWLKLSLFGLMQQGLITLIGDGSTDLWQTWLWVLVAVFGNWFGLNAVAGVIRQTFQLPQQTKIWWLLCNIKQFRMYSRYSHYLHLCGLVVRD